MTTSSTKENIAPVWSRTLGNVTVAVYRNETAGRPPLYKMTRKRWYVSKTKEIQTVTSLFRDDIPCARQLEDEAWLEIYRMQKEDREKAKATKATAASTPASNDDQVLDDEIAAVMAE